MTYYANKLMTDHILEEGEEVFLKLQPFRQNSLRSVKDNKFAPKFYDPYQNLKKIGEVAYTHQLPPLAKIHNTFNVSLLKKKLGQNIFMSLEFPDDFSTSEEGTKNISPAKILARRMVKKHNDVAVEVLVQWQGQFPEDETWESYSEVIKRFPWFSGEGAIAQEEGFVTNES